MLKMTASFGSYDERERKRRSRKRRVEGIKKIGKRKTQASTSSKMKMN
jgi:hypothetical protein